MAPETYKVPRNIKPGLRVIARERLKARRIVRAWQKLQFGCVLTDNDNATLPEKKWFHLDGGHSRIADLPFSDGQRYSTTSGSRQAPRTTSADNKNASNCQLWACHFKLTGEAHTPMSEDVVLVVTHIPARALYLIPSILKWVSMDRRSHSMLTEQLNRGEHRERKGCKKAQGKSAR